jgi:flagellar biosynthesis/type III secretory pathway chaperone
MISRDVLALYYIQFVEMWEQFCSLHQELLTESQAEYQHLLSGEIEGLEDIIKRKDHLVAQISLLEKQRAKMILQFNQTELKPNVHHVRDLLNFFHDYESTLTIPVLSKMNQLLIDVITNLQSQNKKNQVYLNKALGSLQELKLSFTGKKHYQTYGADGFIQRTTLK